QYHPFAHLDTSTLPPSSHHSTVYTINPDDPSSYREDRHRFQRRDSNGDALSMASFEVARPSEHTARWVQHIAHSTVDPERVQAAEQRIGHTPGFLSRSTSVPSLHSSPTVHSHTTATSATAVNTSVVPPRSASIQRTIESLLDEGAAAFASGLHDEAAGRWGRAKDCASEEGDIFLEARALSNLACSLKARGRVGEAMNALWDAWTKTEMMVNDAIEEASGGENPWIELVVRNVTFLRLQGGSTTGRRDDDGGASVAGSFRDESRRRFSGGAGAGVPGHPDDHAFSPGGTTAPLPRTRTGSTYPGMPVNSNSTLTRSTPSLGGSTLASQRSHLRRRHTRGSTPTHRDPCQGPPVVVWLMDLTCNVGNAHYASGDHREAERWHAVSLSLAEETLDKFPPPAPNTAKLSFLHRSCLVAKARALTHLALINPQGPHEGEGSNPLRPSHSAATDVAASLIEQLTTAGAAQAAAGETPSSATRPESLRSVQASMACNAAIAWTRTGVGLHRALERLEIAGRLYRSAGDELGLSRVGAMLGSLCVEVGRAVDGVRWAVRCRQGRQQAGAAKVGRAGREAGPGRAWIEKGVKLLHMHMETLKGARDWMGVSAALGNLGKSLYMKSFTNANLVLPGIAYTLLNQPHLALHFLSRILDPTDPPSTLAMTVLHSHRSQQASTPQPPPPTQIPPLLLHPIRIALWQALASLTSTGRGPWYPAPETTGLPAPPSPDPVNALLAAVMPLEPCVPGVIGDAALDLNVATITQDDLDARLVQPFTATTLAKGTCPVMMPPTVPRDVPRAERYRMRGMLWCALGRLSVDDVGYRGRVVMAILKRKRSGEKEEVGRTVVERALESGSPAIMCLAADVARIAGEIGVEQLYETAGILWGRALGVCEVCVDALGVDSKVVFVGPATAPPGMGRKSASTELSQGRSPLVVVGESLLGAASDEMTFPCPHVSWKVRGSGFV
ncbi:hypothetical protein HK101_004874, partial [Irineochytrium annulatum]